MDCSIVITGIAHSIAASYVLWWLAELEVERQHHEARKPGWLLNKRR
jgi:hypothetical protein